MSAKSSHKPIALSSHGPHDLPVLAFKHILVPIDFSPCSIAALDCALALAGKFSAKVTLLHVVEPAAYPDNCVLSGGALGESNDDRMAAERERLTKFEQKARGYACAVDILVRMGRAQSEISDTARAMGVDLIVLGTHSFAGANLVSSIGGTAERVVRYASCPVLTVR